MLECVVSFVDFPNMACKVVSDEIISMDLDWTTGTAKTEEVLVPQLAKNVAVKLEPKIIMLCFKLIQVLFD